MRCPFALISWGQERIDSGLAAILMAVMPLTTVVIAHLLTTDEKLTVRKFVGVVFGLFGLIVLMGPKSLLALGEDTVRQLAVAGAACCYGINTLITRALMVHDKRAVAASVMGISAAMMVTATFALSDPWALNVSQASLWSAVLLGFLHTGLATLLMFVIVARQGASFFSQLNFLVPLFGVGYGALLLGESLGLPAFMALVIILIGVAIARSGMGRRPQRVAGTAPGE